MSHQLVAMAAAWVETMRKTHVSLIQFVRNINDALDGREFSDADLVDVGYFLNVLGRQLLDEMRKDVNARRDLIAKLIAARAGAAAGRGENCETMRGEHAMAIPDVKVVPIVPKPGTPEYVAFLGALGVPTEIIDSCVLKVSYEQASELAKRLLQEGRNLPSGLIASTIDGMVTFRALSK